MKVDGCIKELSEKAKNDFNADYVLFIKRAENQIISTLVTDEIFPDEYDISTVDGDFENLEFKNIEVNDTVNKNRHGKEFTSIKELISAVEPVLTYTSKHTTYLIY